MNATHSAARRAGTLNWGMERGIRAASSSAAPRKFSDYAATVSNSLPDGIIRRELSAENPAGLAFPFAIAYKPMNVTGGAARLAGTLNWGVAGCRPGWYKIRPLFSGPRGVAATGACHGVFWEIVYGCGLPQYILCVWILVAQ